MNVAIGRKRAARWWRALPLQTQIGAILFAVIVVVVLVGPALISAAPNTPHYDSKLHPPSATYWLGTDQFGRDLLARVIHGLGLSLVAALVVLAGSVTISLILGTVAALYGGWADRIISRVIDVILAIPSLVLALAVVGLLGPGLANLLIALVVASWATDARITRALALESLTAGHVRAARVSGVSRPALAIRHVLPNISGRVFIISTLRLGGIVVSLAGLSFLGLGVQAPTAELGAMLGDGRRFLTSAPWLLIWPSLAILALAAACNMVAEGLESRSRSRVSGG